MDKERVVVANVGTKDISSLHVRRQVITCCIKEIGSFLLLYNDILHKYIL